MAQLVKNSPVMREPWVQSLSWEDPLKGTATHSSILPWRIPWTVAHHTRPYMDFPGKSEFPFPSPGDLPNSGIEPRSPALQADSLLTESPGKPKVTQSCLTVCDPMGYSPPGASIHRNSPGKNTGVCCYALQGIFPTQGSNPGLLHCRQILYCLSHQRSPEIPNI